MLQRAATLDLTDLLADPVVTFQRKYYPILAAILWGLLPTILPVLLWNESAVVAFFICVLLRYLIVLHFSWLVNSWAHMYQWGTRPYNRGSIPVEASIRHLMLGEGFHNYHHAFPCDYSTSELGPLDVFNPPTVFINLLAKLGLAWDLKKPEVALIEKTIAKTGNSAVRYKKGRLLWEWTCGLLCATLPVSGLLFVKYTLRYVYLQYFDELPRLDVGVLWRDAINLVKVHFDVEMAF